MYDDEKHLPERTIRFFYGKGNDRAWARIFILNVNGQIHTRYLSRMKLTQETIQVVYRQFDHKTYRFDGHQKLMEITEHQAKMAPLHKQSNWVKDYLRETEYQNKIDAMHYRERQRAREAAGSTGM